MMTIVGNYFRSDMHSSTIIFFVPAVTPEFEQPDYTVPEDDGSVEVCVMVPAGQIERDVVIQLLTQAGTATSELIREN